MADIKQAAKWAREGRRVESRDSGRRHAIYMSEFEIFYDAITGARVYFGLADLLADDWEIAE